MPACYRQVRQQDVIRVVLGPGAGQQGGDGLMARQVGCRLGSLIERGHLVGIALEQALHGLGHVVGVKCTLVAVSQHSRHAVVTGHDDISALCVIKHIVGGLVAAGGTQLRCLAGHLHDWGGPGAACHEIGGNAAGLVLGDGFTPSGAHYRKGNQQN